MSDLALIIRGLGSLSIMISLREVNLKLEREEDCDKEPATEYVLNTIVEEEDCCKDYLVTTTTSAYSTVGIIEEEN